MTRLHVAHVVHSLHVGGTENGVVNIIQALDGAIRHTVVAMTGPGALAARLPAGTAVRCLDQGPGQRGKRLFRLTRLLRDLRPDIVHSRNWGTIDAVVAGRLARVPTVIHGEHGRGAHDVHGQNRRRRLGRRLLSPLVDAFVAVSFDIRRWLIESVGVAPRKVVTIHNGVDAARFTDTERPAARRHLGVGDEQIVIGSVGRLDLVKDYATLLDAFARLAAANPEAIVMLAGDGPCRPSLEARARRPDVGGRVRLLGERLDVPRLLAAFDVFVLPSLVEGISNTILEAMAVGLPVLATRTGGNPELVEDDATGTLVPVRDAAALATALDRYLGDPALRGLHGKAGHARALEHFSLEQMADHYRNLYERCAGGARRAAPRDEACP